MSLGYIIMNFSPYMGIFLKTQRILKHKIWKGHIMTKEIIRTQNAPAAIGPYSQGVKIENLVFVSGQLPIDPATGIMPENIEDQTRRSLENLEGILDESGSSLEKVVKTTVFLSDMNNFTKMNEVYKQYFKSDFPARSTVQVARLPKDAMVEIEAVAHL
jgi:2-iminobutanoate/2-iminopropanoate deaminase